MYVNIPSSKIEYEIYVADGALECASKKFSLTGRKTLVVTDSGVPFEYCQKILQQCEKGTAIVLPQGESTKCNIQYFDLIRKMQEENFDRQDCIIAVGGGVVSDLCGFVASTFMRGIDFYIVPTTLPAQIDAAIGGKNAIDFNGIKNFVGTFYQPSGILVAPDVLKTLDKRQMAAGFAELLKIAATCDKDFFAELENLEPFGKIEAKIIQRGIELKIKIVEQDAKEKGLRRVLNFGHTLGHALESAGGGRLLHGECVALGMLAFCEDEAGCRIKKILEKWNLPISTDFAKEDLQFYLKNDKKSQGEKIRTVCVEKIGEYVFRVEEIEKILERVRKIR